MAKVTFTSLKLKAKEEIKKINIGDKVIEVKQYLSAEDKNNLLEITLQKASTDTIINTFMLDVLFHLHLVFKYTNISFTDSQKTELIKLYDILESNGIIELVISAIPEEEYILLKNNLDEMVSAYIDYRNSTKGLVDTFLNYAPETAAILAQELKTLDTDKFQQVIDLAAATGAYNAKPQ